ncbi:hypothetical protein I3760_10G091400 [Carya illinoinensis]|nr:hypothetical protein I3760_10G091400 [Carya illinoinensis]
MTLSHWSRSLCSLRLVPLLCCTIAQSLAQLHHPQVSSGSFINDSLFSRPILYFVRLFENPRKGDFVQATCFGFTNYFVRFPLISCYPKNF